jgi:hypothetical protein
MSNQLKRPDLSQWPEWLRNGPVRGYVWSSYEDYKSAGTIVGYLLSNPSPYVYISDDGHVGAHQYAEPVYRWTPEPEEPVLWWRDCWSNTYSPSVTRYRNAVLYDPNHICKPVTFTPWTVAECRRRLAAGDLEEYRGG